MLYAIYSDVHGNLEAYSAFLERLKEKKDVRYFCVGDIVGYGADPGLCIDITEELDPVIVCGNHDWASVELTSIKYFNDYAKKAVLWTASLLGEKERNYLRSLRLTYIDKELTLVHGTLQRPGLFEYVFDLQTACDMIALMTTRIAFIGHSHVPGIFSMEGGRIEYTVGPKVALSKEKKYLVNVGSIGQPRDGDWHAAFCIWDKDEGTLEIRRIAYDVETAQKKILDRGLPRALAERLAIGR